MDDSEQPQDEQARYPRDAAPWLALLADAERVMRPWHDRCDNIDKLYASLSAMADEGVRDRQFQMFWANLEVLRPIIYSRPPVPVVSPRFRDRKDLPRTASEILERALASDIEFDDVHESLKLVRDDLARCGRGVAWVRYVETEEGERATLEHLSRRDFCHGPARKWQEVPWVARRAFMTRDEMEARFGELPEKIDFRERSLGRDEESEGESRAEKQAEVWEIWHKTKNVVVWVVKGCQSILDAREPWLSLKGFFPCPKPVYGTVQPETLIPVPDVLYYRDQLEEINELTARIAGLSEALRLRGFYAGGTSDIGQSVEIALSDNDNRATMIPVSNFAALGGQALKDAIVWLPVDMVVQTLAACVETRKQLIQDVYELTGLSDIMRGQTAASETATAQQIKSQYGAVRVRERQGSMENCARDVIRLKAEIMAEQFSPETLLSMSQVDDVPTAEAAQMQAQRAMQAAQQQAMQAEQQQPGAGQQMLAQAQQQIQQTLRNTVTVEAVIELLRNERLRPFVLDVETDSTIQPDEQEEKARRTEFLTAIGGLLSQAVPALQMAPQLGPFMAEAMRFAAGGFRAGRSMDMALDELASQMEQYQPPQQPGDGEAEKAQVEAQAKQAEMQLRVQEAQAKAQIEQAKAQADMQRMSAEVAMAQQETGAKVQHIGAQIEKIMAEIQRINAQTAATERQDNGDSRRND